MATYDIQNSIQTLDMDIFQSVADSFGGLAKSCRFAVRIDPPRLAAGARTATSVIRDLTYLCEATEFPGRGFNSIDLRYYGPSFKVPSQTVYEDINMTFLCRNDSIEREFFDDWMESINPTSTFDFNYKDSYSTTITLFQFTEESLGYNGPPKAMYAFALYEAYPTLVNPQPVTWADDGIQRLTVSFTYMKWNRREKDNINPRGQALVNNARNIVDPFFRSGF